MNIDINMVASWKPKYKVSNMFGLAPQTFCGIAQLEHFYLPLSSDQNKKR